MDWPARLEIQKDGRSYIKLFEIDAVHSLHFLHDHWKMKLKDQIIVRKEGYDEDAIVCNKNFLSRISTYFRSFVERWNEDKPESTPEFKLENISLDVFKNLVELALTGLLEMGNHSSFADLVGAATFFQMTHLSTQFSDLIRYEMKHLNFPAILWGYVTAEEYHGYVGLTEEAAKLVKKNFEHVLATYSEELMDMSGKKWLDIISDPGLFVISEDDLFRAVCNWVAVDPSKRSDDFEAMAKFIRVGCLSKKILDEYRVEPSIPPVTRMFLTSTDNSLDSQPRTIELVASIAVVSKSSGIELELPPFSGIWTTRTRFFDPCSRYTESVSFFGNSDIPAFWDEACCATPATMLYLFKERMLDAVKPVRDLWMSGTAQMPSYFHELRGKPFFHNELSKMRSVYVDGFIYMSLWENQQESWKQKSPELFFFKIDCSDKSFGNINTINVPTYLRDLYWSGLLVFAGKIHVFTRTGNFTYDPNVSSSKAWSDAAYTVPFRDNLDKLTSCCVGPDGMIYLYIWEWYQKSLWIFNTATSECRATANCTDSLLGVMTVENKVICGVRSSDHRIATRVYDHVKDLWEEPQPTIHDRTQPDPYYLPVRLMASSFKRLLQKSVE